MSFPILEFDPDRFAALSSERFHQPRADLPAACVLCFFHDVIEHLKGAGLLQEIANLNSEMGKHPDLSLRHPGRRRGVHAPRHRRAARGRLPGGGHRAGGAHVHRLRRRGRADAEIAVGT